jgi:pyruvate/2-oxoglutarate dehydrogenase complex dihydrolipoamide dehydrogenase (E3) component
MTEPIAADTPSGRVVDAHVRRLIQPNDEHNRRLIDNVHPASWENPEPADRYNLVVIGGGTAGLVSAMGAAALGARVALVERHLLGGDCLVTGCVPSKALLYAAQSAHSARHAGSFGIEVDAPRVDFARVMERLRAVRADIAPHDSAARLKTAGVDVFLGEARFVERDAVQVDGKQLRFRRAVIATGARPAPLAVEGLQQVGYLTSDTLFQLAELPRRLLVIGAGPIGCEMAQALGRLGAEVTLLDRAERVLPRDAPRASSILGKRFEQEGIALRLGVGLERVERVDGARRVHYSGADGPGHCDVDAILLAVGRLANVEGLGLQSAGVAADDKGVVVDDRLRTSNRRIYAAGDVCSSFKFTHAADAMARVVLKNALFSGRQKASSLVLPWATYTDPEVAHVGVGAEEAAARKLPSVAVELHEIDRARLEADDDGYGEVHYRGKGRILGATLVARHAGDLIGELCLAMNAGVGLGSIADTVHPYPSSAELVKRLGDTYNRTRLTPGAARWLARWLRWTR